MHVEGVCIQNFFVFERVVCYKIYIPAYMEQMYTYCIVENLHRL